MTTIETVFTSTRLKDLWPILSLDCKHTLVLDLERCVKGLKHEQSSTLREVYRCVKSNYEHDLKELEAMENKLGLT